VCRILRDLVVHYAKSRDASNGIKMQIISL
jgi:hypothetical protein